LAFAATSLASLGAPAAHTAYPPTARHSPLTAEVVTYLQGILRRGGGRPEVFVKIGDSITYHPGFLGCLAHPETIVWGDHGDLATTRAFFSTTRADRTHLSWDRPSQAARIGWSTFGALGTPGYSPLRREIQAVKPAFAVVMLGTNEVYPGGVGNYRKNLGRVIRAVIDEGVVPLLQTIPPRRDDRALDRIVVEMNVVVRELAEAERVPLADYGAALRPLPRFGLGSDGIHPDAATALAAADVATAGAVKAHLASRPCAFDSASLAHGQNQRNLLTLEALDRARRFLIDGAPPEPDANDLFAEQLRERAVFHGRLDILRATEQLALHVHLGERREAAPELDREAGLPSRQVAAVFEIGEGLPRAFERLARPLDERVLGHSHHDDVVFFHGRGHFGNDGGVELRELFGCDGGDLVGREARDHARKGSTTTALSLVNCRGASQRRSRRLLADGEGVRGRRRAPPLRPGADARSLRAAPPRPPRRVHLPSLW
jgi:hypothetical protein